ncbi:MAG: single-stranded DNA-binding protein [Aminobacterium sp.]|uniref:single-stranded DNA-binding protein n=1 Tax=unclassified Aminobacterium TaxID=2685012 RepID=UPI001BCE5705|nr:MULTISPECIES: single-stranded DNA-binding protein [unclassified Aminobacterium]MDD2206172.1 single-stranded DNA-binding protein [Aminobacterium sp.]MDD3425467.1 single-stranded DNA-binding protein [Aminobacterium sp.]MDD3707071.1 single-stranded DNA-binding protein [Aminobacterium sp.]MDD4227984.1 single-stranded DNA-binding protein [Aminobacterium sp.]MDD4551169.1 single-stranded DNA-binding protein [Aminobacterium sp.]
MARGFNKVILMGNLSRDPEIRYTASKQAVARLNVAVDRQWKGRNGEIQNQVDFIPIVVWGSQAENCERYLRKGRPVLVEGRLQVRSYEDKSGERRWVTEVVASSVVFLGSAPRDDDNKGNHSSSGSDDFGSIRDRGFDGEEFPLDISEMGETDSGDDEADIPF